MNGLIIGMDLCDSCTHISCQGQETIWSVPTRIGKEPDSDVWRVSEESAGGALEGMVVEDKLLSLAMKDGTATIDGVRYEGLYLLKMFLKQVLAIPRQASGKEEIENLVITVPKLEVKLVDCRFSGNRPEPGACDQSRGELCILRDEPETGSLEQPGGNV